MKPFYIELIGSIAAVLSTGSFIPQVYKAWKTKDTKSLSLPMVLLLFTGVSLWLLYGLLRYSVPLMLSNGITGICVGLLIFLKLKYK